MSKQQELSVEPIDHKVPLYFVNEYLIPRGTAIYRTTIVLA